MFITILNWNNPLTLVYINFIKVAFIVSQPGQQFQRMDFPLEVKCTMDIGQQGQQEYKLTAISFLISSFPGSFGPRSLCHTLCQTSPFLNLWSDPTFYQCNPVQNTWHVRNKDKYTGNMNLKQNCYLLFVFTSNCVQNCNLSYISYRREEAKQPTELKPDSPKTVQYSCTLSFGLLSINNSTRFQKVKQLKLYQVHLACRTRVTRAGPILVWFFGGNFFGGNF